MDLLKHHELPAGFSYPQQFERILKLGITELEPWYILDGQPLRSTVDGLQQRYHDRNLIPFARRQDNDDIACWSANNNEIVYIIHDFASIGWEERARYNGFYGWLRQAVDDMIEFDR